MVRLLIFDIGGVIIDYDEAYYIRYMSKKLHLDRHKFSKVMNPLIERMELGKLSARDAELVMSKAFHVPELDLVWASAYKKLARLNVHVAKLVSGLSKRYRLVLLSNTSASRYVESKRLFLDKVWHGRTFSSCYLHMRKPERKIYLHVLRAMNVRPKEALFIDNMQENVAGARRAGIKAIRFISCSQIEKALRGYGIKP